MTFLISTWKKTDTRNFTLLTILDRIDKASLTHSECGISIERFFRWYVRCLPKLVHLARNPLALTPSPVLGVA